MLRGAALATAIAVAGVQAGCDDGPADARARQSVEQVLAGDAKSQEDYQRATSQLDEAGQAADSAAAQAAVRAARGEVATQRAIPVANELMRAVAEARQAITQLQILAQRVEGMALQIDAIQASEPTGLKQAYTDVKGEVRGDNNRQTWVETPAGGIPTLERTQQRISEIESQIEQLNTRLDQLRQQQRAASLKAQQSLADAEVAADADAIELLATARESSVRAQELAGEIQALQTELDQLQDELAVNQTRLTQQRTYIEQLDAAVARLDASWGEIQTQLQRLEADTRGDVARMKGMVSGGSEDAPGINQLLADVAQLRAETATLLGSAQQSFTEAASSAQTFQGELASRRADVSQSLQQQYQQISANVAREPYLLGAGQAGALLGEVHLDELTLLLARREAGAAAAQAASAAGIPAGETRLFTEEPVAEGGGTRLEQAIGATDAAFAQAQENLEQAMRATSRPDLTALARQELQRVLARRLELFEIAEAQNLENLLALDGGTLAEERQQIQALQDEIRPDEQEQPQGGR